MAAMRVLETRAERRVSSSLTIRTREPLPCMRSIIRQVACNQHPR